MSKIPDIFMAYSSEDEDVCSFLKAELEKAFGHKLFVFMASSYDGLTPGRVWFHELTQKLKESKLVLAMVSKSALATGWVPFECGIAFGDEKSTIPLCHSGMRTEGLPYPLKLFQALDLVEERHLVKLLSVIKREINLPDPVLDLAPVIRHFESADEAADAWQKFNELFVPIYWNNMSEFGRLIRVGAAELTIGESFVDRLSFVSSFCRMRGIMAMRLSEDVNARPGTRGVEAVRGPKFNLLLSRKCAIAEELIRLSRAA
jgi:hypothetical protein